MNARRQFPGLHSGGDDAALIRVAVLVALIVATTVGTARAQEPDPEHRADIERLLEVTGAGKLGAQIANMAAGQIIDTLRTAQPGVPQRAADVVKEVLSTEFSAAFDSPGGLHGTIVNMYAKHFTHKEIRVSSLSTQRISGGRPSPRCRRSRRRVPRPARRGPWPTCRASTACSSRGSAPRVSYRRAASLIHISTARAFRSTSCLRLLTRRDGDKEPLRAGGVAGDRELRITAGHNPFPPANPSPRSRSRAREEPAGSSSPSMASSGGTSRRWSTALAFSGYRRARLTAPPGTARRGRGSRRGGRHARHRGAWPSGAILRRSRVARSRWRGLR